MGLNNFISFKIQTHESKTHTHIHFLITIFSIHEDVEYNCITQFIRISKHFLFMSTNIGTHYSGISLIGVIMTSITIPI